MALPEQSKKLAEQSKKLDIRRPKGGGSDEDYQRWWNHPDNRK